MLNFFGALCQCTWKNIPVDLHMQQNCQRCHSVSGAKQVDKVYYTRIGRAIGTLSPVLDNFDDDNGVATNSSRQKKPSDKKDIAVVVNEIVKEGCFIEQSGKGRKHRKFPKPRNVLQAKEKEELLRWLTSRLPSSI